MEETIQKTDILLQNQPEPLQETPQNPTKKEILRKRKRNFNIYGENFEGIFYIFEFSFSYLFFL